MVSLGRMGDVDVFLGAVNSTDALYFSVSLKGVHYGGVPGNEKHNVLIISPNTPSATLRYLDTNAKSIKSITEEWLAVDADDFYLQMRISNVPGLKGKIEPKIISKGTYNTVQEEMRELGLEIPDLDDVEKHVTKYISDTLSNAKESWNLAEKIL